MRLALASAAQAAERDDQCYHAWGSSLSLPQFREREQRLRAHPWARATMRSWHWKGAAGEVLSSCETFQMTSSFAGQSGRGFAIASVYTEPSQRGRGQAAAMLRALLGELRQEPAAQAAVLFSEIGPHLYTRLGFQAVSAVDALLPANAAAPHPDVELCSAPPLGLPPLVPAGSLQLLPSAEQLDWHLDRERIYAHFWRRPPLAWHGARLGEATASWTANYKRDELQVLTLRSDAKHQATLLGAAQHAAHLAGLPRLRVWETESLAAIPGVERLPRREDLAMYCSLGPPLDQWAAVERALWV